MSEPQSNAPSDQPARVLGGIDATCIVVGAIIGVGIFLNPGQVARLTNDGTLALTAWTAAGGIALCGALTFASLGSRYNRNGAQYEALRDSYGPMPAFLFVFCNATAIQAGAVAVIAILCVQNLAVAAGAAAPQGYRLVASGALVIVGLIGANILGVRWGSWIQNLTVLLKVLTLLVVTVLAVVATPSQTGAPDPAVANTAGLGPFAAVLAALVPCLFAYGGWQHSLWISGEVKNPERNLPRAIVGGVILVIIVYLLANWAYLRLLGLERVASSQAIAADAVGVVWGDVGRRIIAAAVAVSAFGVLNAQLLSGPRLVYGMARDGRFFSVFARLSRFGTPTAAIVLIGGMALLLLATVGGDGADFLTIGAVFVDGIFFVLTGAAVFVLKRKLRSPRAESPTESDGRPALRTIGYPIVPALFVVGELGVVIGAYMEPKYRAAAYLGVAWIIAAAILYLVCFRRR
ncbi:MAG: APC family permease [Phycisphaerales bacterium]